MANTPLFAPGWPGKVSFKPIGVGAFTDVNVQGWDWNPSVDPQDTTHSGSLGVEEWINGLFRGEGGFQGVYDLNNPHNRAVPNINPGVHGSILCFVSSALFFAIPCGIVGTPTKSAVAGKVEFTARFKLDGASGSYATP